MFKFYSCNSYFNTDFWNDNATGLTLAFNIKNVSKVTARPVLGFRACPSCPRACRCLYHILIEGT